MPGEACQGYRVEREGRGTEGWRGVQRGGEGYRCVFPKRSLGSGGAGLAWLCAVAVAAATGNGTAGESKGGEGRGMTRWIGGWGAWGVR